MIDRLDPNSWLHHAQTLSPGERRHFDHDCGSGRTLVIKHGDKGLDAWCYRCGCGGFSKAPELSFGERMALRAKQAAAEREAQASVSLPTPMNHDIQSWPLAARVWLYKAGLTNDEIKRHGFYHHDGTGRVVLPVPGGLRVAYWQARGFDPERAKYVNPVVDKTSLVYVAPRSGGLLQGGPSNKLVLTEDILSAVRVSNVTEAWSILGTSLHTGVLSRVVSHMQSAVDTSAQVAIWLDPDGPGVKGAAKIARQLRAYGVPYRVINSAKDPKCYSEEEIRCHLS